MGQELATIDDRKFDGKAMASLPDQHRQFVIELMDLGITKEAAKEAAEAVGFHPYSGYRLLRDERILAAIREESTKKLAGGALLGIKTLIEIAADKEHKDQYRAAKDLAAINGFAPEHRVVIEHTSSDSKQLINEIRNMATQLGLNPEQARQLIASTGIIEAEFTEVQEQPEDTEMDSVDDSDE